MNRYIFLSRYIIFCTGESFLLLFVYIFKFYELGVSQWGNVKDYIKN